MSGRSVPSPGRLHNGAGRSVLIVALKPRFDNHLSTLELRDRQATLKVEKTIPEDAGEQRLYTLLEQRLA